jgi:hypothetical protein
MSESYNDDEKAMFTKALSGLVTNMVSASMGEEVDTASMETSALTLLMMMFKQYTTSMLQQVRALINAELSDRGET